MTTTIHELFDHLFWADAALFNAIGACAAATTDEEIHARLHHVVLVQYAFLAIARGEGLVLTTPRDFSSFDAMKEYARAAHAQLGEYLPTVTEEAFAETVIVPWLDDPTMNFTREQALMQCVMHSQYHRAQNATRLRALGGEPPLTDIILWWWQKKPKPEWL